MPLARALRRTATALRAAPVLFVPALALALLWAPGVVVRPVAPGWANLFALAAALVTLPVGPLALAGGVGLADAALDGGTPGPGTALDAGRRGYLSVLVVTAALGVLALAVLAVLAVLGLVAVLAAYPGGAGDTSSFSAVLVAAGGVVALVALAVAAVLQFYPQAVVLDGHGALGSLTRSAGVMRANALPTLGHAAVVLALVAFLAATAVVAAAGSLPGPAPVGVVLAGAVLVVLWTLCGGALVTLSTAYYRAAT
jgi:hypothetical protein